MKDYVFNPKKKDQNVLKTLNILVYEYLVKMKFEKTAKTFACEAYIDDMKLSDGPPSLSQWYIAFHEISNVRCGMSSSPGDLSRIEGIMLKLENEKKRYQQMGRMEHMPYYNMQRDPNEMYKSPNMYYPPQYFNGPPADHPPMYVDPRKQAEIRNIQMQGRHRYEEPVPPMKGVGRPDHRFDPNTKSISPKMFDNPPDPPHFIDKNYFLREMTAFKMSDKNILFSVLSKESNILFNVFENRTIGSFNCNTMKNECIVETNGKQITQMRVKDNQDFVWIVASFDTNELMVIRYLIKEVKFEMAGYLRGHAEKIACFDISECIYSLDVVGIFRKWNFKGVCEREEILSGNIQKLFAFTDNCLILSDVNRTYLYDYEINMEMSEISRGVLVSLKKQDNYYILIFKDKVAVYDKGLNKIKVLSVPNNNIKTACLVDMDIVIGSSKILWFESQGRLNKFSVYDNHEVVTVENICKYKPSHMIVLSSGGECKIMSKCFNE
ncbi:hypothetical protein P3W45_001311 [Vairimorpha bombi]|jgi:hypothetical protein